MLKPDVIIDLPTNDEWPEPASINAKLKPVASFDPYMLPVAFQNWSTDTANRMQCPLDYVAVSIMCALASIVGKKGLIHPRRFDDWIVCPNLWGLLIGRPSVMKSPAADSALKLLKKLEAAKKECFEKEIRGYKAKAKLQSLQDAEAEREAKALVKGGDINGANAVLLMQEEDTAKLEAPTQTRYVIHDSTVEKLGEILNENPNGILQFRDEIYGFLRTMEQENRANDRAFFLEAFSGLSSYTFDRIGRGTIEIESTCVSMLGCIQPARLGPYLHTAINGGHADDGLIQRFQLAVYPDVVPWKQVDRLPDFKAAQKVLEVLESLADWEGFKNPIRFNEESQTIFDDWFVELHAKIQTDDIHPALESHYSKYKSLAPSLAVLIHLADGGVDRPVDRPALIRALAWCEYLESHAERIYSAAVDPVDTNALTILDKIKTGKLPDGFAVRTVVQGGWTGVRTTKDARAALTRLYEHGYVDLRIDDSTGGRPREFYAVHPQILPQNP